MDKERGQCLGQRLQGWPRHSPEQSPQGAFRRWQADGTTSEETDVRERVSGGPGLAGTWKEVKVNRASELMIISVPSAGHIKYEIPRQKDILEGPVDGTTSPLKGPSAPE